MEEFKPVGRPAAEFSTIPKTYMFFTEDIKFMKETGATPKELFRLGCIAKRDNPQLLARLHELEAGNDKLQKRLTAVSMELSAKMDKEKEN